MSQRSRAKSRRCRCRCGAPGPRASTLAPEPPDGHRRPDSGYTRFSLIAPRQCMHYAFERSLTADALIQPDVPSGAAGHSSAAPGTARNRSEDRQPAWVGLDEGGELLLADACPGSEARTRRPRKAALPPGDWCPALCVHKPPFMRRRPDRPGDRRFSSQKSSKNLSGIAEVVRRF